ncbi:S8 family serine peptidase [Leucobacter musarum]|uniref:S8 family serine peptidase n=1 Tax=Leucobacter musarum TaxID=1930747 RepID=UPI0009E8B5CA|nr:S8 family serine peptidase [Leucobacter musarum]
MTGTNTGTNRSAQLLVSLMVGVLSVMFAAPAQATVGPGERQEGLWYATNLRFDEIAAQGLSGSGVTIAVIDDAINPDVAELRGADIEVRGQFCREAATGAELPAVTDDPATSHGTDVVSMLVGNGVAADGGAGTRGIVPGAKVLFYAADGVPGADGTWGCEAYNPVTGEFESDVEIAGDDPSVDMNLTVPEALAARQAIADGADIISISSVSSAWNSISWSPVATRALREGIPIVAGTRNPDSTIEQSFEVVPAALNGTVAVGGVKPDGNVITWYDEERQQDVTPPGSDNRGFVAPGYQVLVPADQGSWGAGLSSGTSLATPLVAGSIALGLEKFPSATANQILQALVRTTGEGSVHDAAWIDDDYGYGIVSPLGMLGTDPTEYPDENPLFVKSSDDPRCGAGATAAPTDTLEACAWAGAPTIADLRGDFAQGDVKPPVTLASLVEQWAIPILWGGLGFLVVVATVIVMIIAAARRRAKRQLDVL